MGLVILAKATGNPYRHLPKHGPWREITCTAKIKIPTKAGRPTGIEKEKKGTVKTAVAFFVQIN
jgi:hypothetical protein